jgi:hypothetical protein
MPLTLITAADGCSLLENGDKLVTSHQPGGHATGRGQYPLKPIEKKIKTCVKQASTSTRKQRPVPVAARFSPGASRPTHRHAADSNRSKRAPKTEPRGQATGTEWGVSSLPDESGQQGDVCR